MFTDIISVENLLTAWQEFVRGKRGKSDVQMFSLCLMDNILALHANLANRTYVHGGYAAFNICDPKPRRIHKASVRDRLLHHAIHRVLYPYFDRRFIAASFSCRLHKGTHRALDRLRTFFYVVSKNNTRTCWVLEGDIKKFFSSIDQVVLFKILGQHLQDPDVLWLLGQVIGSFYSTRPGIGLPLGNITSQLLVNVYVNEFDQFMKHGLKVQYYIRYADDFVILSADRGWLEGCIAPITHFLWTTLRLTPPPDKLFIQTFAAGVDFLGWVHFPNHRVLRTTSRRRMIKRLQAHPTSATVNSYLGLLRYGNTGQLRQRLFSVGV